MAGAAPTPSGKGGKKPLDASINLVPFIDLLSCCISFLLITAAWVQFNQLAISDQASSALGKKSATANTEFSLEIYPEGYKFLVKYPSEKKQLNDRTCIPSVGIEPNKPGETAFIKYDALKLSEALAQAHKNYPDVKTLTITAPRNMPYHSTTAAADTVLGVVTEMNISYDLLIPKKSLWNPRNQPGFDEKLEEKMNNHGNCPQ